MKRTPRIAVNTGRRELRLEAGAATFLPVGLEKQVAYRKQNRVSHSPEERNLGGFVSQFRGTAHRKLEVAGHGLSAIRKQNGGCLRSAAFLLCIQSETLTQRMAPSVGRSSSTL